MGFCFVSFPLGVKIKTKKYWKTAALDAKINVFHQDQGKQLSRGTFLHTSLLKGTFVSEGHGACRTGSHPCGLECSFPAVVNG